MAAPVLARPSLLERALEVISPRWAAERAYFRATLEGAREYEAGRFGRRGVSPLKARGTSANAELGPTAVRTRYSARDMVRNNPVAASAVRRTATKLVGTGINPRPTVPATDTRRQPSLDAWQRFVDQADPEGQQDFHGQALTGARCLIEAGEFLGRFLPRGRDFGRMPLQFEVLEPDYLDANRGGATAGGGWIFQGVEYAADGTRRGYWLHDQHPGDSFLNFAKFSPTSRFYPASDVLHVFERLRPGQARGVSMFAPVAVTLRETGELQDAELVRRKIGACFAAFVKRNGPATTPLAGSARTAADAQGRRIEQFSPGMVQYLENNEDVAFAVPPDAGGLADYLTAQLHIVGAGLGIPYVSLTGDFRAVNYSSYRGSLLEYWELIETWQWLVVIPLMHRRVWDRVQRVGHALGDVPALLPARWNTPRRPWVDPVKEVAAHRDAVRSGFESLFDVIAERGDDPEERLAELALVNRRLDELGLLLDSDPRRVAVTSPGSTTSTVPKEEA